MENLGNYLKNLQEKLGFPDPKNLADQLSISPESIKNILQNKLIPDDELCLRIAYLAGDDPALVLAIAHFSSANVTAKTYWEKIFLKLKNGRVFNQGYKDRRSWSERRLPHSKSGSPVEMGSFPEKRKGIGDRRTVMDRRLPSI